MMGLEPLNIRTSKETKAAAEKIFDELGINTSTAFNIFLKAVISLFLPLALGLSQNDWYILFDNS